MGIKLVKRSAWGARAPRDPHSYLASTLGVKVHYMGSAVDARLADADHHHLCDDLVRQVQRGHMDGNGWDDIGYTAVVCPHGYVYVGRGPHALPAANGEGLNSGHYAVLGLVGNKGLTKPTNAMLHGIRDAIEWLRRDGNAGNQIKGHCDGYDTSCPGPALYAWVRNGAPRPGKAPASPPEKPGVPAPGFPLHAGHWFGTESSDPKNHSGYWAADRPHIKKLQARLKERGWAGVRVTGRYDSATFTAVQAFQAEKGLRADGLTGAATWPKVWTEPIT